MKAFFKNLKGEMTPEQEILRNRLVMGSISGFGCFFFAFDPIIFSAFCTFLSFNAALYLMQKKAIWRPEERWLAGIILDVMMALAVMLREPEHMSVFYPIMLWMTLGNGFRFGIKWLFIAAFLSTSAFGIVVLSTTYWQQNLSLGIALAIALIVIPTYCSTLIRKISHAKEQAEMASKAKSYFLASVSHELRTPLNAIIGYGNHLRQSDMPRGQKEMVEASVLAGEHLLHLIEQLIEVAKTGTGSAEIKRSEFRPTDLLTEIRDIMTVRTAEKGLALHLQAEPLSDRLINGPHDVLRNILLNLVGNAVKFTEAGSISINSGFSDKAGEDGRIWFTVSDTGIGIAESATDRIFQAFQQADDTVMNRFGGTGLGLSICKQLVEQVNGTISVESIIGQGSKFRIEVPIELAEEQISESQKLAGSVVKILSFGELAPGLLASAQSQDNFAVRHIQCRDAKEFESALATIELAQFNVALISEQLARQVDTDSEIWEKFSAAEIAPVLVTDNDAVDIEDVSLRAAFASVLPPTPNFAELRSAIRIGCSFARHFRMTHDDDVPAVTIYAPKRVLVADDNRTNRNVLAAILESAGHSVEMVTDGDEALESLERGGFDILLLDINMPRLNGIDACSMWRQIEGGRQHLPIIGVTADATSETEERCKNAGMDLRITKPVNAKLLLATIEQLCGGSNEILVQAVIEAAGDPANVVVPISGRPTIASDAIDPVQLDYLMSIGDRAFVLGMIEGFFEDVEQVVGPLRLSVANNDVSEFRFCAHAFKSSGNNMGAKPLAELCGRLEKITEADFAEHRFVYLDKIERELADVTDALNGNIGASLANQPNVKLG
jgi:two-component system, sensor histidine kinase RpfC